MLVAISSSFLRSDPRRPKRPSAMARTTRLKRWGPRQYEATCVFRNLLFQQSQRRSPRDQLLRPEAKDGPTHYESPAPPPCSDHSWVLVTWKFSSVQRCITSSETIETISDGEPRTATTTSTQLLSSGIVSRSSSMLLYVHT